MSLDTERIVGFVNQVNDLWSTPIQIGISLYMLWAQLGLASITGVIIMIILMPVNGMIISCIQKYDTALMVAKDKRLKILNAILSGIRVLKLQVSAKSSNFCIFHH